MKTMLIACALMLAGAAGRPAAAQEPDRPPRPEMRERIERLERMKQMRLIEELQLGEEEAVRFMAKRKEHEDRLRDLADERDAILDGIEENVGPHHEGRSDGKSGARPGGKAEPAPETKTDLPAVEKDLSRLQEQERKIFEERKRYQDEMRKMLSTERFAKMLLFERDFQMQLRDAVGRRQGAGKRSQKFDE
jgi:hypothetical protein